MPKNCRSCAHLVVKPSPAGRIILHKDGAYPCKAPCPDIFSILPHSWRAEVPTQRFMSPGDGAGCPTYERKATK